jgi:hypothetical protein
MCFCAAFDVFGVMRLQMVQQLRVEKRSAQRNYSKFLHPYSCLIFAASVVTLSAAGWNGQSSGGGNRCQSSCSEHDREVQYY